jgi:signal transduction histidine kinase
LGNQVSFFVDSDTEVTYDLVRHSSLKPVKCIPSPLSDVASLMATLQKNLCAPDSADETSAASEALAQAIPAPADLLQAYSELQQRLQRTTNALGSAAHDLKTPLAILNGYVELLQSGKLGSLNGRQREVLDDMQVSGKRLQRLIQDFLTYSALETGGLTMRFEVGNVNECLSEVCRLWSIRFQEKGLALYFLPNEKLPLFPFDAPKLERVISNLLENSYKFVPTGGTVWLHAEPYMWERRGPMQPGAHIERRRQDTAQPNSAKVTVSDTGPGIPAEFQQEVFDDFFRLPTNENQEGMGLGLAIVRRLVHAMGGKVWVESDSGSGCKFSFLVPFKASPSPAGKGKNR